MSSLLDNFLIGLGLRNRESFPTLTIASLGEIIFRKGVQRLCNNVPQIEEMQEGVLFKTI